MAGSFSILSELAVVILGIRATHEGCVQHVVTYVTCSLHKEDFWDPQP